MPESKNWSLFCDGSSKHGTGYFGYVLYKNGVEFDWCYGGLGGGVKPKLAELLSISYGLGGFIRKVDENLPLRVFNDCKEVIAKAEKDPELLPKINQIRDMGISVVFNWVSRDQNILANDLARKMIVDSRMTKGLPGDSKG